MRLTITPGQLSQRASFYYQLGQLTGAGLTLYRALEQLQRGPPGQSYREPIGRLLERLATGSSFTESLNALGSWLPDFDIALLHAGEQSGRLEQCFRLLADYYNDRARIARQVIADLLYPVFLFHFAVFILPFAQLFTTGKVGVYLAQTLGILLPLYGLVGLVLYAAQGRHGQRWRAAMETLLRPVPVLGSARRDLALARLSAALEALLSAGVTILEAWELAATASGSPALRQTVLGWRPRVDSGQTPAEVVNSSGQFPEIFANQYAAGEVSGKLDDTLGRLRQYYQEEGSRKLHAFATWTPRALYLLIVLLIAYRIVGFWANYFGQVNAAAGGF